MHYVTLSVEAVEYCLSGFREHIFQNSIFHEKWSQKAVYMLLSIGTKERMLAVGCCVEVCNRPSNDIHTYEHMHIVLYIHGHLLSEDASMTIFLKDAPNLKSLILKDASSRPSS